MDRDSVKELFLQKPRHAGRLLADTPEIRSCSGKSVPEQAFNYCYPGSAELYPGCLNCGKVFKNFISFNQGYRKYCCPKCAMTDPSMIAAREQTCIQKYGVKNPLAMDSTRKRLAEVSLDRYGTITPVASKVVRERVKQSVIKRYGVDHVFKSDEVKQRAKDRYLQKYADTRWQQRVKLIERARTVELVGDRTYQDDKIYTWKHSCGKIFTSKVTSGYILACPDCKEQFTSSGETEIKTFIESFGFKTEARLRNLIHPYEIDIFIPEKRLAIEYNGDYFHSTSVNTDKNYHLRKLQLCEAAGIKLINVFEHQWLQQRHIVQGRLKSALGISTRIFARKCKVAAVDESVAKSFLEANHLQGAVGSTKRLGLFFEQQLVALMTFGKPRFNSCYTWELLRYCSKHGTTVVGGAGKLLKAAGVTDVITYADRCWSDGTLYRSLGMMELAPSPPSYFYVRGGQRVSRYQAQKHKLSNMLGENYDETLTEGENMKISGYLQIFDCGNRVFTTNKG